ncbi:MAG TPA: anti-sigma factor [Oscillatoriaceae cyanobacterium]
MTCDDIQDLVALAALDALPGDERRDLDAHLNGCPACRDRLAELREAASMLAYGAPPATPDPALKARVLRRVRPAAAPRSLVAACMLLALGLLASLVLLAQSQRQLHEAEAKNATLTAVNAAQLGRLAVLQTPDLEVASLAGQSGAPGAQARLFWSPERHAWLISFFGLPPLQGRKTYQLWAITGKQKLSLGTLGKDPDGILMRAELPTSTGAPKAAAVSVEPAGGMPQPTGPIVLLGNL